MCKSYAGPCMLDKRLLVVGTTGDYIDHIRTCYPGRALFVTDPTERAAAAQMDPAPADELLCDLQDSCRVHDELKAHLSRWRIEICGVVCYDCESLGLAANLAKHFALPFPAPAAVVASRNKFLSKQIWQKAAVPCPRTGMVRNLPDALNFMERVAQPVIIKPLTGSGSELLFKCDNRRDCFRVVDLIGRKLAAHANIRMYRSEKCGSVKMDPHQEFVIEEFIDGREYSCDFMLNADRVEIIRLAKKILARDQATGTTLAYVLPGRLPEPLQIDPFRVQLRNAARALGLDRALCMVDFIVHGGVAYLLEMTPRPGGDCLPQTIFQSCGLDMLGLALDFAEGKPIVLPVSSSWVPLVGLRLMAKKSGIIKRIDDHALQRDSRVKELCLKRRPGQRVVLPPDDYESRLLGHVIFKPTTSQSIETECEELESKLIVEIEAEP
jgi:D-alanine-D-alanine ligase-like ATP-grasp enzyme